MELDQGFSSQFHASCMVRRSAYEAVGMVYKEKFNLYADVDLWLRLIHKFDFVYLNKVYLRFRKRESKGHFLSGQEFEIINWLTDIFLDNYRQLTAPGSEASTKEKIYIEKGRQQLHLSIRAMAAGRHRVVQAIREDKQAVKSLKHRLLLALHAFSPGLAQSLANTALKLRKKLTP